MEIEGDIKKVIFELNNNEAWRLASLVKNQYHLEIKKDNPNIEAVNYCKEYYSVFTKAMGNSHKIDDKENSYEKF